MSYRLWQQQYASDPSIIGSTLLINDLPATLVGITPPKFFGDRLGSNPPDLWIPLNREPAFEGQGKDSMMYSSGMAWLFTIARLKPGVSPAQLRPQLTLELQQWLKDQGRVDTSNENKIAQQHIRVIPAGNGISDFRDNSKAGLYLLSAVSVLVLLIACANLANLLLARSVSRRQQTALRLSLGATRSRLIRAALTENALLSLLGGIAGVLLAFLGAKAILLIAFRGANYVPIDATPSLPIPSCSSRYFFLSSPALSSGSLPHGSGPEPTPSKDSVEALAATCNTPRPLKRRWSSCRQHSPSCCW
jgi:hypothetical protein